MNSSTPYPSFLPPLPDGAVYLGKGKTFKVPTSEHGTYHWFEGWLWYPNIKDGRWATGTSLGGRDPYDIYYAAPANSAIAKLNNKQKENVNKEYYVKTYGIPALTEALQKAAFAAGVTWKNGDSSTLYLTETSPEFHIYFTKDGKLAKSRRLEDVQAEEQLTPDKWIEFFKGYKKPFSETIPLNDNHSAVVTKDSIKVGCQTFTHKAIAELYSSSIKALAS